MDPAPGPYRRLVLSPHLDDAALSCGGSIHRWTAAGERVLVVTLVTADPPEGELSSFARYQHDSWQLPSQPAYQVRREEDKCAMAQLGADYVHLGIPDCIYRGDSNGFFYTSDEELFGLIHPADMPLEEELVGRLEMLEYLPDDLAVYAPLGLGNHVDHQLVRRAAERWSNNDLNFYEDFPYAGDIKGPISPADCTLRTVRLEEADIQARIDAIACYASQIGMLFKDLGKMESSVRRFVAQQAGGEGWAERFWRPAVKAVFD